MRPPLQTRRQVNKITPKDGAAYLRSGRGLLALRSGLVVLVVHAARETNGRVDPTLLPACLLKIVQLVEWVKD